MIAINFAGDVPSAYYNNACSSCAENFGELFGILQERVIFFFFFLAFGWKSDHDL